MQPLSNFLFTTAGMGEEIFLTRHNYPFFITSKKHLQQIKSLEKSSFPEKRSDRFSTMISNIKSNQMEKDWLRAAWICPIHKEGGGEMQMINLGGTANNAIVIHLPWMSKFHCWFLIYGPQEVYNIDGGSTNGTFLNEARLETNEKKNLKSGDIMRFGSQLEFEFYFPQDLWPQLPNFKNLLPY